MIISIAVINLDEERSDTYTYIENSSGFKVLMTYTGRAGRNSNVICVIPILTDRHLILTLSRKLNVNKGLNAYGYRRIGTNY